MRGRSSLLEWSCSWSGTGLSVKKSSRAACERVWLLPKGHLEPVATPEPWENLQVSGAELSCFGAFLGLDSNWEHLLRCAVGNEILCHFVQKNYCLYYKSKSWPMKLSTGVSQRNIFTIQNDRVRNIFQLSTVVSAAPIDAALPHLESLAIHWIGTFGSRDGVERQVFIY